MKGPRRRWTASPPGVPTSAISSCRATTRTPRSPTPTSCSKRSKNAVSLPLRVAAAAQSATVAGQLVTGNGIRFEELPAQVKDALHQTSIMIGETVSVEHLKASGGATQVDDWAISDGSRRWELSTAPEQLRAWRVLKGGPQAITVGGFDDPAAVLDALVTQNQLRQELIDRLAASSEMPVKSYRVTPGVLTPTGAQGWRAVIVREIVLEIPPFGNGAIRFTDARPDAARNRHPRPPRPVVRPAGAECRDRRTRDRHRRQPHLVGGNRNAGPAGADRPDDGDRCAAAGSRQQVNGSRYTLTATETFLLEVIDSELTVTALAYQNSSILSHLETRPENRNPDAYRRLSAASFPWTLPFDLPIEETRALLDKLGVSRRMLLKMALPDGPMTDRRTAEILGLSSSEASIIAPPPGAAAARSGRSGASVRSPTASGTSRASSERARGRRCSRGCRWSCSRRASPIASCSGCCRRCSWPRRARPSGPMASASRAG